MSVRRIACPDCRYTLLYATMGAHASYKTEAGFTTHCRRREELQAHDAMSCPTLRAAAEPILGSQLSKRPIES